ncbi:MAG: ThuA domain-containing protein, partial [Treponema sp.]|nr:ThuA domain-containing protein [Treponema sp.]
MKKKALILSGGWDGHEPKLISARFKAFLESEDFEVSVSETTDVLEDLALLKAQDLFIPVWTMGPELPKPFFETVAEAVGSGTGLAGCHGGMCDAFRSNVLWQFMTGANWVAHPG